MSAATLDRPEEIIEFSPGAARAGARRAGIYVRISSDPRGTALGVARQEQTCRVLAALRGWDVAAVYCDNDISASTKSKRPRPEFDRMMIDIQEKRIDAVICFNLARLTRRMLEGVKLFGMFSELGCAYTDSESSDTTTSGGRMIVNIKLSVAQQQAEQTAELVREAKNQRRNSGLMDPPTTRCFGYQSGAYTEHNVIEKKFLVDAFAMIASGATTTDLAQLALSRGLSGTSGSVCWRPKQLHLMLRRPAYAGLMTDVEGALIPAKNVLALIDPAIWHAVQAVMEARSYAPRATRRTYLLSGLITCSCGTRMMAQPARIAGPTYRARNAEWVCTKMKGGGGMNACGATRSMQLVDDILDAYVRRAIETASRIGVETVPIEDHSAEIARIEAEIAGVQADVLARRETREDARVYLKGFREDIQALRIATNASARRVARAQAMAEVDQLAAWSDTRPESLPARRAVLAQHVAGVEIAPLVKGIPRRQASVESVKVIGA